MLRWNTNAKPHPVVCISGRTRGTSGGGGGGLGFYQNRTPNQPGCLQTAQPRQRFISRQQHVSRGRSAQSKRKPNGGNGGTSGNQRRKRPSITQHATNKTFSQPKLTGNAHKASPQVAPRWSTTLSAHKAAKQAQERLV